MPDRIPILMENAEGLDEGLDNLTTKFNKVVLQRNIALVCAFFCLVAALAGGSVAVNARNTARDSQAVADKLNVSQIEACHRGNESRVSRIGNYKRDIVNAKADINFAGSFAPVLPATGPLAVWTDRKVQVITGKRESIAEEKDSISQYAIRPGSSVVNCALAYPK